jgi:hypothetical protein
MGRILIATFALWASSLAASPAFAASVTLSRETRPVTAAEIAGGAPIGGFVHDFFVTSSTDLLSVGQVAVTAPLFQHTLGSDVGAPTGGALLASTSLSADSFITLPGQTSSVGGGFDGSPGDHAWFDASDDGPQQDALWARLTTMGQTGEFSGRVSVRGYDAVVSLPFCFSLPGTESDLALLAGEPTFTLEYSLDPPPAPAAPAPQPPLAALPEPPLSPPTAPESLPPLGSEPDPRPELPAEQPAELPLGETPGVVVEEAVPPEYELVIGGGIRPLPIWTFDPPRWDGAVITIDDWVRPYLLFDEDGSTLSLSTSRSEALSEVALNDAGSLNTLSLGDSLLAFASTSAAAETQIPEPTTAGLVLAGIVATLAATRCRP